MSHTYYHGIAVVPEGIALEIGGRGYWAFCFGFLFISLGSVPVLVS